MNGYIGRQAAIDALTERDPGCGFDAVAVIEKLPPAQLPEDIYTSEEIQIAQDLEQAEIEKAYELGKEDAQQWIPCSERLPEIKDYHASDVCMVYCDNGAYGFSCLVENMLGQVGWECEKEDDYRESLGEVIAWMPLPEPYTK